jgi:hypothetical protein
LVAALEPVSALFSRRFRLSISGLVAFNDQAAHLIECGLLADAPEEKMMLRMTSRRNLTFAHVLDVRVGRYRGHRSARCEGAAASCSFGSRDPIERVARYDWSRWTMYLIGRTDASDQLRSFEMHLVSTGKWKRTV